MVAFGTGVGDAATFPKQIRATGPLKYLATENVIGEMRASSPRTESKHGEYGSIHSDAKKAFRCSFDA